MERIGVLEASNAAGGGDIGMVGNGAGRMESAVGSSGVESSPRWSSPAQESAGLAWPGTPSTKPATGKAGASANPTSTLSVTATEPKEPDEPPLERPMSPDEQRGFSAPADWLKNEPWKGRTMNVYFAILTVIFGPLIFMAFLRWLSKRVRRPVAKAELLSPDEWLRKYGVE